MTISLGQSIKHITAGIQAGRRRVTSYALALDLLKFVKRIAIT